MTLDWEFFFERFKVEFHPNNLMTHRQSLQNYKINVYDTIRIPIAWEVKTMKVVKSKRLTYEIQIYVSFSTSK